MDIELVTDPYACIVSPLAGLGGVGAYNLFEKHCVLHLMRSAIAVCQR